MRCLGLLALAAAMARAEDPAHKAARERQERFKTVEAKLKQVSHIRKGSQSAQFSEPSAGTGDIPAEDMTLEARIRVILDGKKARVEDGRPTFYFPSGKLLQRRRLSVTDTAVAKTLNTYAGDEWQAGTVWPTPVCAAAKDEAILPLLVFFRGNDPSLSGWTISGTKRAGESQAVDGAACDKYSIAVQNFSAHFWLEAASDYRLRRYAEVEKGHLVRQIDVAYAAHPSRGTLPSGWTNARFAPGGRLLQSSSVVVEELRFPEAVPPKEFELVFPPKTRYTDMRHRNEYEVRDDGSRWDYDPSGAKPPAPAPETSWLERYRWPLVAAFLVLALGFYLYCIRRKCMTIKSL
ncbi:MAG: hypothetical protein K2W96_14740 [Gemmataceae bacterium]|nr:hypothetical protein [Gemmataceae bacterium]